ncbi:Uncharacterised protein [Escherichia coli]|uniref:Uncharacterized protein n=1 Tax=Escherichia coli TaxID=562 RepID=A0A2X1KG71_ECOLX|nr:Uncharacterised protein [Escherichia coli]
MSDVPLIAVVMAGGTGSPSLAPLKRALSEAISAIIR